MNKAIIFAVLAFVAVAAAKPGYGGYQSAYSAPVSYSVPVYSSPVYSAPAYSVPASHGGSSAAAAAAAASSAPGQLLYNVNSYGLGSSYGLGGGYGGYGSSIY